MNKQTKEAIYSVRDGINKLKTLGYNDEQLKKIVSAVIFGFTDSKLDVVVNSKFDHRQMEEIVSGFLNGLSIKNVRSYAKLEIKSSKMRDTRLEMIKEKKANSKSKE